MTSTERVRRWRLAHSERNREQGRRAQARYRGTLKGFLRDVKTTAYKRGNR
jgi:hypothetical protein